VTTRQRIAIGIGALLVAARVFFPASKCGYEPFASVPQCVSLTVTILHVIGIAVLTWLTAVIFPWPWWIIDTWWRFVLCLTRQISVCRNRLACHHRCDRDALPVLRLLVRQFASRMWSVAERRRELQLAS
jgi:hypothetical protein